jgi:sulfide:quinone oxidoreductase
MVAHASVVRSDAASHAVGSVARRSGEPHRVRTAAAARGSILGDVTSQLQTSVGDAPRRVVIAGGGFAAVEALLALRALDDSAEIELVGPDRRFHYRPAATAQPFDRTAPLEYDLAAIADELGAAHRVDRIEAVAPAARIGRLTSDALARYDALILATGVRRLARIAGALTFAGPAQAPQFDRVLSDLASGAARRIVFAIPNGVSWALPLYELALLTVAYARERNIDADVAIVTPERAPLDVFGAHASALVRGVLDERGVRFLGSRNPERFDRDRRLYLRFGADPLPADRVIAAPSMVGRPIVGIPGSWHGFVPTDERGRVEGLDGVYAAGDMTTFPIKQGGLATQQADTIAAAIAARAGRAPDRAWPVVRMLRARLIGGERPVDLVAVLDAAGRAVDARLDAACGPSSRLDAPASAKVYGRYLAPYLSARAPLARTAPEVAAAC